MLAKPHRHPRNFVEQVVDSVKDILVDIFKIKGDIKVRLRFCGRTVGDDKKVCKLTVRAATKALSNIGHYRDSRAPDLISQAEIH